MSLKNCPDCGSDLGRSAMKCRCGWVAPGAQKTAQGMPEVRCAGHPLCRFSGRLWVRTLQPDERLCVDHYYIFLEKNPDLRHDPTVPPKGNGMILAKPVAGS